MRICSVGGCKWPVWRTDKLTRLGYCNMHWKRFSTDLDRRSSAQKIMDNIKEDKVETEEKKKKQHEWFLDRRKEMSGKCAECGGKTTKDDDKLFKHSICHILPKRDAMFPSVATNSVNFIELCYYGNSCHSKYDGSWESAAKMRIWPYVVKIANQLYPLLTRDEKARVSEVLLQEIRPEVYNQK